MTRHCPGHGIVTKLKQGTFLYSDVSSYLGLLKGRYASPPGRAVHVKANKTSLRSFQPRCNYFAKTIRLHTFTHLFLAE